MMTKLLFLLILALCGCASAQEWTAQEWIQRDSLILDSIGIGWDWTLPTVREPKSSILIILGQKDDAKLDTFIIITDSLNRSDILTDTFKIVIPAEWQIIKENEK